MESGQREVELSSPPSRLKQRPPPAWVPYAGSKRKAHIANLGDHFDSDCRPSPAKQFAVDEAVAGDILRDGFYYDPALPPPPPIKENQPPAEEVEMEEALPEDATKQGFVKCIGEATISPSGSMSETVLADEKGCRDESVITSHSMHESQPISPKKVDSSPSHSIMHGLSLVLSNEIQETLIRRKLNEDFILPKSIMSQVSGINMSMALVPWKPPTKVETFIQQSSLKEKVLENKLSLSQRNPESENQPSPQNTITHVLMPVNVDMPMQPGEQNLSEPCEEDMDVDISF